MPTYQYACTACGEQLEVVQKFSDEALTECPNCSGRLRKVFSAVGIVFKGSGFYRTDNRSGSSTTTATTTKSSSANGSETKSASSDSGSAAKTESKPAAEKVA
ncbi:FmdB family zinc ribbon protein [Bailinhaonella thermotolerans]|uniref:FmdB family transcriptional regulator n=1 Tax=Bailinhaonella thermotolerans TaxID=1070861 RepID=A0A3A4AZY2_9ACTN|nr:FmdB family zinc ribbon protein [Bailinhaonella thermotolerans]RJL33228.1 FmdB family transcriptional regulator [Bailinhaonella thermotolerans]